MRFLFKTSYDQDLRLFKHGGQVFWYSVLAVAMLAAPWWASEYLLSQLHFIGIYSIVGLGLMLLVGFTGQISLGHAAFLAVGAYTEALMQAAGWPFWLTLPCAALFSAAVGIIVGLPALRLKGIYLAIATLAFGVIVEEIITRWQSLTGGNEGKHLKPVELLGWTLESDAEFYYVCLALTVLSALACINLLRSPTGRAFVAIRDSEISASCLGVNLAKYKTMSFAFSAALTGVGGALYAHKLAFISPE
ncbi:MAG TPA: branched-chain amino acid ABC transporter permease, partial [Burkholderiales bacterium]